MKRVFLKATMLAGVLSLWLLSYPADVTRGNEGKSSGPEMFGSVQPTPAFLPAAGEQIKWQILSGGGGNGTSTNYAMSGTIGQTAVGPAISTSYKVSHGYWQNFSAGSCCTGTTGNVNMSGSVDLADLSALVSYLTGGGYVLTCTLEANVNGVGAVDLADLSALVAYLTGGGYVLPSCP